MVPLGTLANDPEIVRAADHQSLQPVSVGVDHGRAGRRAAARARRSTSWSKLAAEICPQGMGYEWTGMAYQEKRVGGEAVAVFAMAVLLVYLVLAAQYESWFMPWAVILVVPLGSAGRRRGRVASRHGQQRLHADRHRADHRAGEQERDSDRRVCPRAARPGARRFATRPLERRGCGSGRS